MKAMLPRSQRRNRQTRRRRHGGNGAHPMRSRRITTWLYPETLFVSRLGPAPGVCDECGEETDADATWCVRCTGEVSLEDDNDGA